jgi:hypothetical protein
MRHVTSALRAQIGGQPDIADNLVGPAVAPMTPSLTAYEQVCPSGTYLDATNGDCLACPAGTFSSAPGSTSCTPCAAGTYAVAGSVTCTSCLAGTYSTTVGASDLNTCVSCPTGTYTTTAGATSISTCKPKPGPICPEHSEPVLPDMECYCGVGFTGLQGGPCTKCSNCISTLVFTAMLSIEIDASTDDVVYSYRIGVAQSLTVTIESVAIVVLATPPYRRLLSSMLALQTSVIIPTYRESLVRDNIKTLGRTSIGLGFEVSSTSAIKITISDTPSGTSNDTSDGLPLNTIIIAAGITIAVGVFICILVIYLRKPHKNHHPTSFPVHRTQYHHP